jgi:hypothetical protein
MPHGGWPHLLGRSRCDISRWVDVVPALQPVGVLHLTSSSRIAQGVAVRP